MRLVIPSVGYADFLAVTLPAWLQQPIAQQDIIVVTNREDVESRRVAESWGVAAVATDAWHANGAALNKAAALDAAFAWRSRLVGAVCLAVDADVFPIGTLPPEGVIKPHTLYGCPRFACPTPELLADVVNGRRPLKSCSLILPRQRGVVEQQLAPYTPTAAQGLARRGLGYFQLFRYKSGICFGHSETAGGYDVRFRRHFAYVDRAPGISVLHLGEQTRENWRGRAVPAWTAGSEVQP